MQQALHQITYFKVKKHLQALIIVHKLTKLSTKHCNSKNFCTFKNVLRSPVFCFTNLPRGYFYVNLPRGYFYVARSFLYYLKILVLPVLLVNLNKMCCNKFFHIKIFVSFVKLLTSV